MKTKIVPSVLRVMTTQSWPYYYSQLDYPKSKRIKIHILKGGNASYCGLRNRDDEEEMKRKEIDGNDDVCQRCKRGLLNESSNRNAL